jgi:hypothetical protein
MAAAAFGQQQAGEPETKPSAADITRGRAGGDGTRTSTGVEIQGNANQGAGVNTLTGATSDKTLRIEPTAAVREEPATSGTSAITVTGAAAAQPVEPSKETTDTVTIQPQKTSGTTSPSAGATDTGAGAER